MNLALIYNTSSALVSGSASCPGGLACLLEQVGEAVVRAWHNTLQGEMGLFQEVPHRYYCHDASTYSPVSCAQIALAEWDVLRPTVRERYNQVAREMKTWLEKFSR